MAGRGEVLIRILGDSSSLDTALAGSTSKLSAFGEALTSPAGLATAAGIVIAGALFKIGEDFNNAFIVIRRETGATGTELGKLEDDFKNVVSTVPAKFGDAADAVSKLHMELGLNGEALDKESEQVLELNRITGGVLSETVAGVTNVFNNWQISTKDQAGALDLLFRASQQSGATMQSLFDDMKAAGPIMRAMGFSFEETTGMMAGFEKEGFNTQQIMAGMRIGLGHFAKANEEPRAAFARLIDEIKSAPTSIEATRDALDVFGKRSGIGLRDAIASGRISFDDLIASIKNGKDTIRAAGEDTMTLGDKWRLFKNEIFVAVQPVASAFFGVILDGASAVIDGFKDVGQFVSDFVDDWENGTDKAGVGAAHLKDVVHTVWRVIKEDVHALEGIWQPVADAVGSAWDAISNTFKNGSPALADAKSQLGELKSAIWDAFKDSPTFIKEFGDDWDTGSNRAGVSAGKIKEVFHSIWDTIRTVFNDIKGFISDFSDDWRDGTDKAGIYAGKLAKVFHSLWETIKSAFESIKAAVEVNLAIIGAIIYASVKFLMDLWTRFGSHLVDHIKKAWGIILDTVRGALELLRGVFDIFAGIFTLNFSKVWKGITEIFGGAWDIMVGILRMSLNTVSTIIGAAMAIISSLWGYIWGAIKTVVGAAWEGIKSLVSSGVNAVVGFVSGLAGDVAGLAIGVYNAAVGVGNSVINGIKDGISNAAGAIAGVASAVMQAFKDAWNTAAGAIDDVIPDRIGFDTPFGFVGIDLPDNPLPRSLASGGVVASPTLAMIGDAGAGNPEIVTPEKLMRKIVSDELHAGGAGGTTIIVHGNVYDPQDMHEILDKHDRHMRRRMRTRRR